MKIFIGDDVAHDDSTLMDAGVDSVSAIEVRNRLSSQISVKLPATFVFDHPTIRNIADYLMSNVEPAPAFPHQKKQQTPGFDEVLSGIDAPKLSQSAVHRVVTGFAV